MKLTHIQPFVLQKNKVGETKIYLIFYNPFGKVIYFCKRKFPDRYIREIENHENPAFKWIEITANLNVSFRYSRVNHGGFRLPD